MCSWNQTTGRIRLFLRVLVLDSVTERFIAHRCLIEANVGPEAVFGTDERTSGCGHH